MKSIAVVCRHCGHIHEYPQKELDIIAPSTWRCKCGRYYTLDAARRLFELPGAPEWGPLDADYYKADDVKTP